VAGLARLDAEARVAAAEPLRAAAEPFRASAAADAEAAEMARLVEKVEAEAPRPAVTTSAA
jgi:hypothetical protein